MPIKKRVTRESKSSVRWEGRWTKKKKEKKWSSAEKWHSTKALGGGDLLKWSIFKESIDYAKEAIEWLQRLEWDQWFWTIEKKNKRTRRRKRWWRRKTEKQEEQEEEQEEEQKELEEEEEKDKEEGEDDEQEQQQEEEEGDDNDDDEDEEE